MTNLDSWETDQKEKTRRKRYREGRRRSENVAEIENEKKGEGRNEKRKKKYKVTDLCREMVARRSHKWLHRLRGTALNSLMEKTANPGAI